jgi:hypothetical protein
VIRTSSNFQLILILLLFLASGVFHFAAIQTIAKAHRVPASFPIVLRPGSTSSPNFSVNIKGNYVVELRFLGSPTFEQLSCAARSDRPDCGAPYDIQIEWVIDRNSEPLKTGHLMTRGYLDSGPIDREFAYFDADVGNTYQVKLQIVKDASLLSTANPEIRVSLSPVEYKQHVAQAQILQIISVLLAAIATIWAVILVIARLRQRT